MGWSWFWNGLSSVVLPDACVACDVVLPGDAGAGVFCAQCALLTTPMPSVHCEVCCEPGSFAHSRCVRCRGSRPWSRVWAPFEHEGALARAIHRFKYEDRADLSRPLARLWRDAVAHVGRGVVVPIPLHASRFRDRGFDQAALLAAALAASHGLQLELDWLRRVRSTERQVGLDEGAREANVAGAFDASAHVHGQRVVLVDDVFTTGATVQEAARVLRDAGASEVTVLTLARARREHAA